MRFLSLAMVCLIGCAAPGINSDKPNAFDADAMAAFALVSHQDVDEVLPVAKEDQAANYTVACAEALKSGKPLIMGAGCPPVVPVGYLGTRCDWVVEKGESPYLIIALPVGGELARVQKRFAPDSSVSTIKEAVKGEDGKTMGQIEGTEVRQAPAPFPVSSAVAPDHDGNAERSAWPDALDEVNALRVRRGLRPFIRDAALTVAAASAARFRAARRIAGHSSNDFAFLPAGGNATAAGCAAWPPNLGFGSCCLYENWTYAGASYAMGADGLVYYHLFVR